MTLCSAFLTVFDRNKELFCALLHMLTAVAVSLLQAEREKEVRLDLKEIMTFADV